MSMYNVGDRVNALKPGTLTRETEEIQITKVFMNGHGGDYYRAGKRTLMESEIIGLAQAPAQETDTDEPDPVNHPEHYTSDPSGIECIEVTRHRNFNIGNAIKYLWRAGIKDDTKQIEDLKKAAWYINDEINRLEQI